jgi:hypothetical protein
MIKQIFIATAIIVTVLGLVAGGLGTEGINAQTQPQIQPTSYPCAGPAEHYECDSSGCGCVAA